MTLTQSDYYPWTYYTFFVNNDVIRDVGELRQQIVEDWEQLGRMWLTMRSDSGAGDCEAVSMQMVDSLNILCDWHSDYHNGRHCRFLSVWLYYIDCIAIMFSVVFAGAD